MLPNRKKSARRHRARVVAGFAFLGSTLGPIACSGPVIPEGERVPVTIDPWVEAGRLDTRYLGFAVDTAQLTGALWWRPGGEQQRSADVPDLESLKLRRLASYLAPSIMRIGGLDCDATYFCRQAGPCEMPASYRDVFTSGQRVEGVLTHETLRRAADFAAAVGASVLFCINFGVGPRDQTSGEWIADDARLLLRVATSLPNGEVFDIWEPGNEPNAASANFDLPEELTPALFARDLMTLRALVAAEDPGARIVAPGSQMTPAGEVPGPFTEPLMAELAALGEPPPDALSWHLYATQSAACPDRSHPIAATDLFDEVNNDRHRRSARETKDLAGGLPVWNTESASARCGGQAGLSDTMTDALWTADWLGLMAEGGTEVVIRHSLVGADDSLVDPDTLEPRPTLILLAMMKRLVHRVRLATGVDRNRLKAHGYRSTRAETDITAVLTNFGDEPVVARIALTGGEVTEAKQWILSTDGGLTGTVARVNGESTTSEGVIPDPPGVDVAVVEGAAFAEVPPFSVAFVTVATETGAMAGGR